MAGDGDGLVCFQQIAGEFLAKFSDPDFDSSHGQTPYKSTLVYTSPPKLISLGKLLGGSQAMVFSVNRHRIAGPFDRIAEKSATLGFEDFQPRTLRRCLAGTATTLPLLQMWSRSFNRAC